MGQPSRILQFLHVAALVLGASSLPTNIRGSSTYLLNLDYEKVQDVLEPPTPKSAKVDKSVVDQMEKTLGKISMDNMINAESKEHTLEPHATKWLCIWSDTFCFPTVIAKAERLWVASLHRRTRSQELGSGLKILGFAVAICAVMGVLFVMFHSESAEEKETEAKSYHEFWALRFSEGSWAQTLQNADGPQKEALELLFRSNIIPQPEFAYEQVNTELIKDRIDIAQQMLKQKSLEKWLVSPKQAKVAFDDSVAKEIRAERQKSSSPNVLQSLRRDTRDPRNPRPDSNASALIDNVAIPQSTPIPSRTIASSKDDGGRNALLMRCREIMKDTDRGRPAGQVWKSAPQLSSAASTAPTATASAAPAAIVWKSAPAPLQPDSPQPAPEDQIAEDQIHHITTSRSSVL